MGSTNLGLHKQLQISIDKTYFDNPADPSRKIYVLADPPHLIKLIRNNFIAYGFQIGDKMITSKPISEIVSLSVNDLKLAYKINESHLSVKGYKRQCVKSAVHLLSNSVANGIKFCHGKGLLKSQFCVETSDLINLIDSWFDVMNSSMKYDLTKENRNAFSNSPHQVEILDEMMDFANNVKVRDKVFPFQKGIIISSTIYKRII